MEKYLYKQNENFEDFQHINDEIKELAYMLMSNKEANVSGYIKAAEYLIEEYPTASENYLYSDQNYGILFYCAGYNGSKQEEIKNEIYEISGVEVF